MILDLRHLEYNLLVNTIAAAACSCTLDMTRRQSLLSLVDDLQESTRRLSFLLARLDLPDYFNKTPSAGSPKHKYLSTAEQYVIIARLFVAAVRSAAVDEEQEILFLERFSQLVMLTILQSSPMRRRAYIVLGVLSAELQLTTLQPLVNALQIELLDVSEQQPREALAIVLGLSITDIPDPLALLKLSLAISTLPVSSIASAGLLLFLQCLKKLQPHDGLSTLEGCLTMRSKTWIELQELLGVNTTPKLLLCLSCFLLQTFKITREKTLIRKILQELLHIYAKESVQAVKGSDLGPAAVFFCALSNSVHDMTNMLASIDVPEAEACRSCEHALHTLFSSLRITDDRFAIAALSILVSLLANAETTEDQIRALKTLAIAAQYLPLAFQAVYDEVHSYLRSVLQRSNHLPLLKAAQQTIIAKRRVDMGQTIGKVSHVSIDRHTILREMGFDCFTRDWNLTDSVAQELAHKKCISNMILLKEI